MARIDEIVEGRTELAQWKVERYREIYRRLDPVIRLHQSHKWSFSESEASVRYPCVHRTKTTGQHTCRPCGGSRVHTICHCDLLDRLCTVRASDAWDRRGQKRQRVLCCMRCEHRNENHGSEDHAAAD